MHVSPLRVSRLVRKSQKTPGRGREDDAMEQLDEHQALASRSRVALLDLLRERDEPVGVEELAAAVGLHVNTTREHLDRLAAAGMVARERERRHTRGRPRVLYRRVEPCGERMRSAVVDVLLEGYGASEVPVREQALAAGRARVETMDVGEVPEASSPAEAVDALVAALGRLGFVPEREGMDVRIHGCPVADLAATRPDVVCAAHEGMTAEFVSRLGAPVELAHTQHGDTCLMQLRAV